MLACPPLAPRPRAERRFDLSERSPVHVDIAVLRLVRPPPPRRPPRWRGVALWLSLALAIGGYACAPRIEAELESITGTWRRGLYGP